MASFNAGLRAADLPEWVLKRAAASLPDWPSSVRNAHSGTLREGLSAFLGAVMGGLWDERPFDRGRTRCISPCARYIVDAACHLRSGFWDAQYARSPGGDLMQEWCSTSLSAPG